MKRRDESRLVIYSGVKDVNSFVTGCGAKDIGMKDMILCKKGEAFVVVSFVSVACGKMSKPLKGTGT